MSNFLTYGKSLLKEILFWGMIITGISFAIFLYKKNENDIAQTNLSKMEAVCPALLSISRSARDTLIVMKSEPLCNMYVLDNLK